MNIARWFLFGFAAVAARGQNPIPSSWVTIPNGARVRVLVGPNLEEHVGRVVSSSHDSLVLAVAAGGSEYRWPTSSVRQLDISGGMKRNEFTGGVIGLAAGAAVGYYIAQNSFTPCNASAGDPWCNPNCNENGSGFTSFCSKGRTRAEVANNGALFGAIVGAHLGVLVGFFVHREAWTAVFSNVRVQVVVAPQRVGFSVPLALDHWP